MTEELRRTDKECAIDYFKRIVPMLNKLDDEQKVQALLLIWGDAYWTGHGNARTEMGEKPLIPIKHFKKDE